MIYLFNFLVIDLKKNTQENTQEMATSPIKTYKNVSQVRPQENTQALISPYQETYENVSQVRPQENTQEIATSPYGGILISRLHLILPSVSPIIITRLFFLIYGVSKIK